MIMAEKQEKHVPEVPVEGKAKLFNTAEGRILISGLILGLLYVAALACSFLISQKTFQVLTAMTATHVLFGRAAAMSFGYTMDLEHATVVPVNLIIETIMVLLFYPLFVLSWQRLLVIQGFKNLMDRISVAARTHQKTVRRYGILGLMVFVWFPFWMTGPLVGGAIGFLLGLPAWLTLVVVLSGTYLAIGSWAVILLELHERVARFSPYGSIILLGIVMLIAVIAYLLHRGIKNGEAPDQEITDTDGKPEHHADSD